MAFRVLAADPRSLSAAMQEMRPQAAQLVGVDLLDTTTLASLSPDRQRQVVMSWGIVEPGRLREILAARAPPARTDVFAVRFGVTVPVSDSAAAQAALARLPLDPACVRPPPRGDPGTWRAWLDRLPDPESRRAVQATDAAYLCASESHAAVVRLDRARAEVDWSLTLGWGGTLAAAAEPFAPAPELSDRLAREGFFDGRVALRTTPDEEARFHAAILLFKLSAGFDGLDPEGRAQLWPQAVREIGSFQRLVDGPPRLFSEMVSVDGATFWQLTPEGEAAFGSLPPAGLVNAEETSAGLARAIRLGGDFASPSALTQTVHEAGSSGGHLFQHFVWPHAAVFALAHPGTRGVPLSTVPLPGDRLEVDRRQHRLWLRPITAAAR
jgi:hypothetical protein